MVGYADAILNSPGYPIPGVRRAPKAIENAARKPFTDNVLGNTTAVLRHIKNIKSFRPVNLDLEGKSHLHRVKYWQNGRNIVFRPMATNEPLRVTDDPERYRGFSRFSFSVSSPCGFPLIVSPINNEYENK